MFRGRRVGQILLAMLVFAAPVMGGDKPVRVLIIGGQNNHDWKQSTPYMKEILDAGGGFRTVINNAPSTDSPAAWDGWRPEFTDFDCVVLDYNGQMWPERVQRAFEDYIAGGGGAVVIHAANNSFTGWKEYERMVGLLWRGQDYGYSLYVNNADRVVRVDPGKGRGMGHGGCYDWVMTTRNTSHSITRGMPTQWLHKHDELYHGQRGPAEDIQILLTAYSDPEDGRGGTGKHEPIVWWVPYGKGKVVTNLMGHLGDLDCMRCVGFKLLLRRSCEWLAVGTCRSPLPDNFPTADETSVETSP